MKGNIILAVVSGSLVLSASASALWPASVPWSGALIGIVAGLALAAVLGGKVR